MNFQNRYFKQQFRSNKQLTNIKSKAFIQIQMKLAEIQIEEIGKALILTNDAFKSNIKISEIYLILIVSSQKKYKLKTKDVQHIYQILSQNKFNQITFDKAYEKQHKFRQLKKQQENKKYNKFKQKKKSNLINPDQTDSSDNEQEKNYKISLIYHDIHMTYKRLYTRLIEKITRKITFYFLKKQFLQFITLNQTIQLLKILLDLFKRYNQFKDLKIMFETIKNIYKQNTILEQAIYKLLVDDGHVISLQQFFRINGIILSENPSQNKNIRISVSEAQKSLRKSVLTQFSHNPKSNQQNEFKISSYLPINETILEQSYQDFENQIKNYNLMNQNNNLKINVPQNIEKANKQIQKSYYNALDIISLMREQQQIGLIPNQKQKISKINKKILSREISLTQQQKLIIQKWKKQRQIRNSENSVRKSFQYFSTQFKEVLKQHQQKKIIQHRQLKSNSIKPSQYNFQFQKNQKNLKNLKNQLKNQMYPNQTINIIKKQDSQDPLLMLKMINNKLQTLYRKKSQQKIIFKNKKSKDKLIKNKNKHNLVKNLLKIYYNKQKMNYVNQILTYHKTPKNQNKIQDEKDNKNNLKDSKQKISDYSSFKKTLTFQSAQKHLNQIFIDENLSSLKNNLSKQKFLSYFKGKQIDNKNLSYLQLLNGLTEHFQEITDHSKKKSNSIKEQKCISLSHDAHQCDQIILQKQCFSSQQKQLINPSINQHNKQKQIFTMSKLNSPKKINKKNSLSILSYNNQTRQNSQKLQQKDINTIEQLNNNYQFKKSQRNTYFQQNNLDQIDQKKILPQIFMHQKNNKFIHKKNVVKIDSKYYQSINKDEKISYKQNNKKSFNNTRQSFDNSLIKTKQNIYSKIKKFKIQNQDQMNRNHKSNTQTDSLLPSKSNIKIIDEKQLIKSCLYPLKNISKLYNQQIDQKDINRFKKCTKISKKQNLKDLNNLSKEKDIPIPFQSFYNKKQSQVQKKKLHKFNQKNKQNRKNNNFRSTFTDFENKNRSNKQNISLSPQFCFSSSKINFNSLISNQKSVNQFFRLKDLEKILNLQNFMTQSIIFQNKFKKKIQPFSSQVNTPSIIQLKSIGSSLKNTPRQSLTYQWKRNQKKDLDLNHKQIFSPQGRIYYHKF